jgi:hypothetical protein
VVCNAFKSDAAKSKLASSNSPGSAEFLLKS